MSKRKLQKLVERKLVSGWNDPRMPTLSGMRRRGYTPNSIRDFAQRIGISKVDSITDVGILEASIRDDLNVVAPRTMAVINPIKLVIENYPENKLETLQSPIHPQNEEMGKRKIFFGHDLYIDKEDFLEKLPNNKYKRLALDKEVRLRNAYVIKANRVEYNENGDISTVYCTYDPETLGKNPSDGRKVKGVIHFVEASKSIKAEFRIYDRLFLDPNPGRLDDLTAAINPESIIIKKGFVEPEMLNTKPEMTYQFEREGYFCRDNQSNSLVFNKTVGLRDTWNQ
jgi:glutaminyl-tRNA synthetase